MPHRIAETYAPLDTDFNRLMAATYPNATEEQTVAMRAMFFAGAACSYFVLTEKPELTETVFVELADQASELERVGA